MAGIGIGVLWISYALGLYGYCLIRGYNVTLAQLVSKQNWTDVYTSGIV